MSERRIFGIDKQSLSSHVLKEKGQCYWTLVAEDPEDKSGNYLINTVEINPETEIVAPKELIEVAVKLNEYTTHSGLCSILADYEECTCGLVDLRKQLQERIESL